MTKIQNRATRSKQLGGLSLNDKTEKPSAIKDAGNAKRSEAATARPRNSDGTLSSAATDSGTTGSPEPSRYSNAKRSDAATKQHQTSNPRAGETFGSTTDSGKTKNAYAGSTAKAEASKTGLSRTALVSAATGKDGKAARNDAGRLGNAGEVIEQCPNVGTLLSTEEPKISQLSEIHKLPKATWPLVADHVLTEGLTVDCRRRLHRTCPRHPSRAWPDFSD